MTTTKPPLTMLDLAQTGFGDPLRMSTAGVLQLTYTDAGALVGPTIQLLRDSISPAASDLIGYIKFDGKDTGTGTQNYASILGQILDATPGSEDGALFLSTCVAGVDTVTMTMLNGRVGICNSAPQAKLNVGAGVDAPVVVSGVTPSVYTSEAGPTAAQIRDSTNDTVLTFGAHASGTFQDAQGVDGARHYFQINNQNMGIMHDNPAPGSGADLVIGAANYVYDNPQTIGVQIHSNPYIGSTGTSVPGTVAVTSGGAGTPIAMNRSQGDGELVAFFSAGTFIGNITCAAGVVSYNAFSGSHWSQLVTKQRAEILRGTIVESLDEMCDWEDEDPGFEEHLPKFKISDTAGSSSVYGVFMDWMHKNKALNWGSAEEFLEDDAVITSLGACMIRISAGVEVARGDLIESAGNGCGRVQADNVFRSSTVAKVTAKVVLETYPDGSYLVPCTLHCG